MAATRVAPATVGRQLRRPGCRTARRHAPCLSGHVFAGVRARVQLSSRTAIVAGAEDYSKLTIVKLKEELRARGLPLSGSKAVLARRLQDSDASDAQSATATPRDTASLFPNGGPMPDFSEVTKHELLQELRRRGDPILGRSKIDLYDRLQQLTSDPSTGYSPGGSPTPILDDLSGVPTFPVSDVSLESSDPGSAYKAAYQSLSSSDFDPSVCTALDLSSMLQALQLPSGGRKAEMIYRLEEFREKEGLVQSPGGGQFGPAVAASATRRDRPEDVQEIRSAIARMSDDDVAAALRTQGVVLDGDPRTLRERLELMLLVEAREERGGDESSVEALTEQARDEVCSCLHAAMPAACASTHTQHACSRHALSLCPLRGQFPVRALIPNVAHMWL